MKVVPDIRVCVLLENRRVGEVSDCHSRPPTFCTPTQGTGKMPDALLQPGVHSHVIH